MNTKQGINSTVKNDSTVECVKCHKQVSPENVEQTKNGSVCKECIAKAKRNKITALCSIVGCIIVATLIWIFALNGEKKSETATGFDGVAEINDSINVELDSVNVEFNLATATLSSSPICTQAPITNIEEFKRVVAQNVESAKLGKENILNIPVSTVKFSFKSSEINSEASGLIKEIASLYEKTNKEGIIVVDGYACNIGEDAPNDAISQQRAEAVMTALVSAGVNPSKIELHWYGKSKNAEFNLSQNADNRRVLISVK